MIENNNLPAYKRPLETAKPLAADEMVQLPPWLQEMRTAISEQLSPDVMKDVIGKQVEKARAGDIRAAGFVMDQAHKLMQAETARKVTIVQNNYHGAPPPPEPARPSAGTSTPVVMPSGKPFVSAADRMKQRTESERTTNCQNGYGGD